jgi:hypothetical protein
MVVETELVKEKDMCWASEHERRVLLVPFSRTEYGRDRVAGEECSEDSF